MTKMNDHTSSKGSGSVNAWELTGDVDFSRLESREIMVPAIIDKNADAETLGSVDYSVLTAVRAELLQLYSLEPRKLASLTMVNDSMEPSISTGDTLFIDTSVQSVERCRKRIYLIKKSDNSLVVCRVDEDDSGVSMWVDMHGEESAERVSESEWLNYSVIGRVVMRTAPSSA